ncbi:MAG: hydroxyacylglutathione hydrolase, partial [Methylobacillus glycogenes]|nr:hydroxyacylglutathione hydrolase [Methylobacillus glycogenes]
TAHNLRFALSLQPTHVSLLARQTATTALRAQGLPSLPSSLALELATNPFLRCHEPGLQDVTKMQEPLEVFTQLRQMRNSF